MTEKQRVLLTGASGSMGHAAFLCLRDRREDVDTVLLLRPSKANKRLFAGHLGKAAGDDAPAGRKAKVSHEGLTIVWGDLTCYEDVLEAVRGVDVVLHPAALIAPAADHAPDLASAINVGGTENLIRAIKACETADHPVKLVNVASVAMYGDRLPPWHSIRCGDPLNPSPYDFYATTKIRAERAVIESGLRYWASLRQTFIAIPNILSLMDPIMFHQPLHNCIELITDADAGFGLAQAAFCPDEFWGHVYNMSGGPRCRASYIEYMAQMFQNLGLGHPRDLFERQWFCHRNFHCGYFEDGHVLFHFLGHCRQTLQDHYQQVLAATPWYVGLGRLAPKALVKKTLMRHLACGGKDGPGYWLAHGNEGRISAFWGTRDQALATPGWDAPLPGPPAEAKRAAHGYDDTAPDSALGLDSLRDAAQFRGGQCLSPVFEGMHHPVTWRCAFAHTFQATPAAVLRAGHWCPACEAPPWDLGRIAQKNPYLAQVYYNTHDRDEAHVYGERCFEDIF